MIPTSADYERIGGVLAYKQYTFAGFKSPTPALGAALEAAKGFAQNRAPLYLHGPAGTGKTHLATAAVRDLPRGRVVKVTKILRDARPDSLGDTRAIEFYSGLPALVIDDLGVEKGTDFAFSILYEIIDARYMAMKGGLIITSNLNLNQLALKLGDDRLPSRIAAMCKVISLAGEKDMRLSQNRAVRRPQTEFDEDFK